MSSADSDSIHSIDVPPPVPPKDEFRPAIPPKDFPKTFFSTIGPSNSSDLNFNETPSTPEANTAKRTKKPLKKFQFSALGSLFAPATTTKSTTTDDDVPRISSRSDSMFSKFSSWWSNLRLKPRNTTNVAPIAIPSTSSSAASLITPQITDDINNTQQIPKVKKSKKITDLSSVPSRNPPNKKNNFGTFIEKLNRKFSFSSGSRPAKSSSSSSTYQNGSITKENAKQKQKLVDDHDLTASTQTLCPDESSISTTHSTAAETIETHEEDENIEDIAVDVLGPLRYSMAKSNASDDTIRGASGTNRHSRLFDIFTSRSSSQRGSSSSRASRGSVVPTTNGIPNRHIRVNSNSMKDPINVYETQQENYENRISIINSDNFMPPSSTNNSSQICSNIDMPCFTLENEGEGSVSGNDSATEGQAKSEMSPLLKFKT
ncbi:4232_t:CDS:2 [Scutellospora calospora]|uniref:4232_t:CDS:1 n=1 Tax=Scutellospora calospora TaxID=85575 RepID=A0ACA9LA53_9GLOM|nr:4232_t:CDS:2 [Scutellospora calospora]